MTRPWLIRTVQLTLAMVVVFVAIVWWETPNLHVEIDRQQAVIHMELLGEYPADIRSIEIAADGVNVPGWKIEVVGDLFQIHSFPVRVG